MAESPAPGAAAESCGEEQERCGERRPSEPLEPRGASARGADREDEAGPSEPDSPVAAPFFLLYPGDGGAGFTARPPPQRAWRTPPSPGSPLPFLLLSYPSGGSGGGGKHRECWARGPGRGRGGRPSKTGSVELRLSPGFGAARAGGGVRARGRRRRRAPRRCPPLGRPRPRPRQLAPPRLPRAGAAASPGAGRRRRALAPFPEEPRSWRPGPADAPPPVPSRGGQVGVAAAPPPCGLGRARGISLSVPPNP